MPKIAYDLTAYTGSRDYKRLAELARESSIICIVDYKCDGEAPIRDIARTNYNDHSGGVIYQISALGIGYVLAFNEDEFVKLCERSNVEFIEP